MFALDALATSEISDGSGDLENAVVSAGGEVHGFHRVFEIAGAGGV